MYQITIDGSSGSGKTSVAKLVSEQLDIMYINPEIIVLGIAFCCVRKNINPHSEEDVELLLKQNKFKLTRINGDEKLFINNVNETSSINHPLVKNMKDVLNDNKIVQKYLNQFQRFYAKNQNLVVEGYDSGTNLFPNAKYKFVLKADIYTRAKRKHNALLDAGADISYDSVVNTMIKNDGKFTGDVSKVGIARDTTFIDTSHMHLNEIADEICKIVKAGQ